MRSSELPTPKRVLCSLGVAPHIHQLSFAESHLVSEILLTPFVLGTASVGGHKRAWQPLVVQESASWAKKGMRTHSQKTFHEMIMFQCPGSVDHSSMGTGLNVWGPQWWELKGCRIVGASGQHL